MGNRRRELIDAMSIRLAIAGEKQKRWRERRAVHSKRTAMLLLGAALSVGGVTEAFDQVRFVVQKDLDGVQVVRTSEAGSRVVARAEGLAPTPTMRAKVTRVWPKAPCPPPETMNS